MKRNTAFTCAAMAALSLGSCATNAGPDRDVKLMNEAKPLRDTQPPATNAVTAPIPTGQVSGQAMPVVAGTVPAATAPVGAASPGSVAARPANAGPLNPEHGKPGHRCDIPVGAPLSTPPQKTNAQTPAVASQPAAAQPKFTMTPAGNNTNPAAAPVAPTAPGMNPPHGQPGHRCDIAVGQPLNSKGKASIAPLQQAPSPATNPAAVPSIVSPAQPVNMAPPPLPERKDS